MFTFLKFLHVLGAIAWVGGSLVVALFGARSARMTEPAAHAAVGDLLGLAGRAVFGPASAVTLLAGIGAAVAGDISLTALWIVWGYGGVLLSGILGGAVLTRDAAALDRVIAAKGPQAAEVAGLRRRLSVGNAVNLVILVSVVWAMVAKPTL